jgi:hypothetical protein
MPDDRIYTVKRGDCISNIAEREGLFWQTLWDHNPALKSKRKNPNILFPGDQVIIPARRSKEVTGATESRHRFRKEGVPALLRIVLERDHVPIKNTRYVLTIDGKVREGTTNGQGLLEADIPPQASQGKIEIEDLVFELELGGMDPIDETAGIQDRLKNLGFYDGDIDGEMGPETEKALALFQSWVGIDPTGKLDQETNDKLLSCQDQEHEAPAQEPANDEPAGTDSADASESEPPPGAEPPSETDSGDREDEAPMPDETTDRSGGRPT